MLSMKRIKELSDDESESCWSTFDAATVEVHGDEPCDGGDRRVSRGLR